MARFHPEVPGLGLGLWVTQAVARAHGGEVTVASPGPGRGATFTLRIPQWTIAPTEAENAARRLGLLIAPHLPRHAAQQPASPRGIRARGIRTVAAAANGTKSRTNGRASGRMNGRIKAKPVGPLEAAPTGPK